MGDTNSMISDLEQRVATLERLLQFTLITSNEDSGSGSAALGANCPATSPSAPYIWVEGLAIDQSTVFVPAWK